jgi:DNA-binding beta-propeller fold protein YncE
MCGDCGLNRRTLLKGAAAWLATAGAIPSAHASSVVPGSPERATSTTGTGAAATLVLGALAFGGNLLGRSGWAYELDPDWGAVPAGIDIVDATAVAVNAGGEVIVLTRGTDPVIVFDREGRFLRSWGRDTGLKRPHGLSLGRDGDLWITDEGSHTVRRHSPEGRLLGEFGRSGTPAEAYAGDPFNRCTHTAIAPDGAVYVSDGYANARIHKYKADGEHLLSWGEPGTGPGQFNIPHNICCDASGLVYVADRENHRIQVFDGDGRYLRQWNNLSRPCGLFIDERGSEPLCYIAELGATNAGTTARGVRNLGPRVTITRLDGEIVAYLGCEPMGYGPGQFVAPHGIATDADGSIYVAEVSNTYWPMMLGAAPRTMPTLKKLRRVEAASGYDSTSIS